jgi:hypothetical protein
VRPLRRVATRGEHGRVLMLGDVPVVDEHRHDQDPPANFDGDEIVQTVADRPRLEAGGALTRWIGEYRDYASFDGIRVPSRGEVRWELSQGPFTSWRGTITSLEARG